MIWGRRQSRLQAIAWAGGYLFAGLWACYAVQPVQAQSFPDPPHYVDLRLQAENTENGLYEITGQSDGVTQLASIGGRDARLLVQNGTGNKYLYLDVDDLYYSGAGPGVTVMVEYYSANDVTFWVEYDAADGSAFKASSSRQTGDAGEWRKALFWLPDPRFIGSQNGGADLRVATSDDTLDFHLAAIAVARPVGPFVLGDRDASFAGETFADGDKLVLTTYFYWYDAYSRNHFIDFGDDTDGLTDHPVLRAGVPNCAYLGDPNGPLAPADYSFRNTSWHARQLDDLQWADIDIVLPVWWGDAIEAPWSVPGVEQLVKAMDQAVARGENPPRIGMFYDTTTLATPDEIFGLGGPANLLTEDGRNLFLKQVIDFWSLVPPRYWARIDGEPVLYMYLSAFASAWDQQVFDDLETRFGQVFGGTSPYVVRDISWTGVTTESTTAWNAALNGPTLNGAAAVGPGFDNSAVPGGGLSRSRMGGDTYINDWNTIINTFTGDLVHVETWSEWHEATEIAESQEYGRQYLDLTQQYAATFKGNFGSANNAVVLTNTIPSTQYAGRDTAVTITVINTGESTWSEATAYRLGAVDDTDPFLAGNRIALPPDVTVAPGETYTFTFDMTAPAVGTYTTDWRMVQDGPGGWFGETHRETVEVVAGTPACQAGAAVDLISNPQFVGGRGPKAASVTGLVPDEWRATAEGSGAGDIEITPLAADELYPGSPPTNALLWRIGTSSTGDVAGDVGLDKDGPTVRETIPAEQRVYLALVDVRDGGVHGGSPAFNTALQFDTTSRSHGIDPDAVFETTGVSAVSDTAGQLSVRFDLGENVASVELDNARVYDVTETNRVVNPGFENSTSRILDWRFFAVAGATGSATLDADAFEGANAALLERTNTDGDSALDLDLGSLRVATIPGETLSFAFAAKKVSGGSNARLKFTMSEFDLNGASLGSAVVDLTMEPSDTEYQQFTFTGTTSAGTAFVTPQFRVTDESANPVVGAYLIDAVDVSRQGKPRVGNILTEGDFEGNFDGFGTSGGGFFDLTDTITVLNWRFFAVGGAFGSVIPRSAAATSGALGIELQREATASGDSALDKDIGSFLESIPSSERVYQLLLDARDAGAFGGTPLLNLELQFPGGPNRGFGFDPGPSYETWGFTARSNTSGQMSVRFDLGANDDRSVYFDNARVFDVTFDSNRLINGSFENSDTALSNWRFVAVDGAAGSASLSSDAAEGANALLLDVTDASNGDAAVDLWGGLSTAVLPGETIHVDWLAKKVAGVDTRLKVEVQAFDINEQFLRVPFSALYDPTADAYEALSTGDLVVEPDVYFISIGFRVADGIGDLNEGTYLIDDVVLMADSPPNGDLINVLANGDFESDPAGTSVSGTNIGNNVTTFDGWRVFAVSGGAVSVTSTVAAATSGALGVEFARNVAATGDRAFDNAVTPFEILPSWWYAADFYVKTGNADSSDQVYNFGFPLFDCDFIGSEPGALPGQIATSSWQRVSAPAFSEPNATTGHISWRLVEDGGEDAIMIALPAVFGWRLELDVNNDGSIDFADFAEFMVCTAGPGMMPGAAPECPCFDTDADDDVDIADLAELQVQTVN